MLIIDQPTQLHAEIKKLKQQGKTIALVATMGMLHTGHIKLVEAGLQKANIVIVSIFVNSMQFNNANDLENYPKTEDSDCKLLKEAGVYCVFKPSNEIIYPRGIDAQTYVEVPGISNTLEGKLRPGHFRGVSTIINKLFNLVQPDYACFGRKDFQQLIIIQQMVNDLNIPIEIIPVETQRESSGLAMSSRNNNLNENERNKAPFLSAVMNELSIKVKKNITPHEQLIKTASKRLNNYGFKTDVLYIIDSSTLKPVTPNTKEIAVLMAAFLGETRLIDNQIVQM
ncbi:MAG: pantoate--beta-alanine ligase [Psychromonas sp.]|nr:pantoate--beta-alanine ligase [Psychromonas sp.]